MQIEKGSVVIKIGGNELEDAHFMERLAEAVAAFSRPVIIVHGGGRAIGQMQEKLGLRPIKLDGLRVTDEPSLAVAQMVLSGDVNKRIVRALLARGVQAIGISGVDGGMLRCVKKAYPGRDLGMVGEIVRVNSQFLELLVGNGLTPVISPISLGLDGATYNVNADEAAGAIAADLQAAMVWFISNVHAVLNVNGQPIDVLTPSQSATLIENGIIRDGMVPKVHTALKAVQSGVPQAVIANIEGLVAGNGTRFVSEKGHAGGTAPPTQKEF